MNAKVLLLLLIGISFVCSEKAVICYYGTWATYRYGHGKFDVEHIDPNLCTHLIYTFAGINNQGNVISLDPYLDLPDNWGRDNFGKFNALKLQNPNLKTLLAVGGWNEGSGKYSIMAANPTLRRNFIDSSVTIVRTHGFDGLDFDWEYPNRRDTVNGIADIKNYSQLLKELREEFDKYGLLLTAAVSSVREAASQSYDIPEISKYLDIINIMTYDMYGAWDTVTGHNAPLHKGEGDDNVAAENLNTVDQALPYWISAGCPPEKIAVGVPLYGRTFRLTDANMNTVRAPSSGAGIAGPFTATSGTVGYNEASRLLGNQKMDSPNKTNKFCNMLQTESWTQRYDSLAKVPYAFKGNDWVSYDDFSSIVEKIEFAKSLGINKVMIWSIETDDFHGLCGEVNPLLTAINITLNNDYVSTTPTSTTTLTPSSDSTSSVSTSADSTTVTSTTIATSSSTALTTEHTSATTTEITVTEDICHDDGFAANPSDCTSFYMCVRDGAGALVAKEFKCPANLYWDQNNLVCNYPETVECNV